MKTLIFAAGFACGTALTTWLFLEYIEWKWPLESDAMWEPDTKRETVLAS